MGNNTIGSMGLHRLLVYINYHMEGIVTHTECHKWCHFKLPVAS